MHCIIEFNQSQWLKLYLEFNTHKKKFKKKNNNNGKLMNNAIYGKTMENLRNRIKRLFKMYIKTKPYFAQNI